MILVCIIGKNGNIQSEWCVKVTFKIYDQEERTLIASSDEYCKFTIRAKDLEYIYTQGLEMEGENDE